MASKQRAPRRQREASEETQIVREQAFNDDQGPALSARQESGRGFCEGSEREGEGQGRFEMMNDCKMEPGHPEWTEFRRRVDKMLLSAPCNGPHSNEATFQEIMNAPSLEEAFSIADKTVAEPYQIVRAVLAEMGLTEGAIKATLENFGDLGGNCDCTAPAEMESIYETTRFVDAHDKHKQN